MYCDSSRSCLVQGLGLFIQKFSFMPMQKNNEENASTTQVPEITFELFNDALDTVLWISFSLLVVSAEITFRAQLIFFASLAVMSWGCFGRNQTNQNWKKSEAVRPSLPELLPSYCRKQILLVTTLMKKCTTVLSQIDIELRFRPGNWTEHYCLNTLQSCIQGKNSMKTPRHCINCTHWFFVSWFKSKHLWPFVFVCLCVWKDCTQCKNTETNLKTVKLTNTQAHTGQFCLTWISCDQSRFGSLSQLQPHY